VTTPVRHEAKPEQESRNLPEILLHLSPNLAKMQGFQARRTIGDAAIARTRRAAMVM